MGFHYCRVSDLRRDCQVIIDGTGYLSSNLYKNLRIQRPDITIKGFVGNSEALQVEGMRVLAIDDVRDIEACILVQGNNWMYEAAKYIVNGTEEIFVISHFSNKEPKRDCIVVDEARFIFVPVYKVIYSSMREMIRERFASFAGTPPGSVINTPIDLTDSKYLDYYKFSFVRNPFSRIVSCYEDKLTGSPKSKNNQLWRIPFQKLMGKDTFTFEDFVYSVRDMPDSYANAHWRSQWATLYDGNDNILVDHIGHLENIQEDFRAICRIIGMDLTLPLINVSKKSKSNLSDYYNEDTAQAIIVRYKKDFEVFGYNRTLERD